MHINTASDLNLITPPTIAMRAVVLFFVALAAVAAAPPKDGRIVGGSVTTINVYPFAAALLLSRTGAGWFGQACGGAILNNRSILTAAHCFMQANMNQPRNWRIRVGSTWASSGGTVHNSAQIINHPQFNRNTLDLDVTVLRSATNIGWVNNAVQPSRVAGANYNLGDNQVVWAIGWGATSWQGPASEQLRHVQIWTINQNQCAQRYAEIRRTITANMLCSGWWNVGGRDQCQGDSGGPLLHNGVVVGVCSWGEQCAHQRFPGVNVRVSRVSAWITSNA